MNKAAQQLGSIKTEKKAKTSKENGKLGGRPMQKEMYIKATVTRKVSRFKIEPGQVYKVIRHTNFHKGEFGNLRAGYIVIYKKHQWIFIAEEECEVVKGSIDDIRCPYCNRKTYSHGKLIHDYVYCTDWKVEDPQDNS